MTTSYRLLLLEDDQTLAETITQTLHKQNLYSQRIEVQALSYAAFEDKFGMARNSTRELIVLGGKASLQYEPDARLLKTLVNQLDRTHIFVLTSTTDAKQVLGFWQPGVHGVLERHEQAAQWLVKAIQRIQIVQLQRVYTRFTKQQPTGFWGKLRSLMGSVLA
ncbi:hypothetical protein [Rufibacter psychrotolerans]|uniref:hypothetical protein n=1 Tax=Rufibacter psychrotolerans TaxID=2812556 RepID=UPI0019670176|nr:hypothetical protein [Rufibacter sp. SYSU D00308]